VRKLKIVTWNCNGGFRNKFDFISTFNADLYIIQECENPTLTLNADYKKWASNHLWIGETKNKGLGVFSNSEINLEKLNWINKFNELPLKHFLPFRFDNKFDLLAVWTHKNNSQYFGYIGQFWKYLQVNKDKVSNTIIAGDFNSNSIWDASDRWWNHSDVVNELKDLGIESIYHNLMNEHQGKESNPTLFFQKNLTKTYHIDYIFAPKVFRERIQKFEIGKAVKWLELSDHMPIFCEIDVS
jgi:exonuclease III